jgi:hypothetical protein
MSATRIIALAKATTAAEHAAETFLSADTTETSQLDERALKELIQLADDLATKARTVVQAAGDLLAERAR